MDVRKKQTPMALEKVHLKQNLRFLEKKKKSFFTTYYHKTLSLMPMQQIPVFICVLQLISKSQKK